MLNGFPGDFQPPRTALIAASDESFRSFLEYALKNKGLLVAGVSDGAALAKHLREAAPDVLLVESRLPGLDIKAFCAGLRLDRRTRTAAVVVLAAEGDESDEKAILESGADQYLRRPFSPEKLVTSIFLIWQEGYRASASTTLELLTYLDLEVDLTSYRVRRNGRMIHLAPTEFRLLQHLIRHPQKVYSRDELQNAAWPRSVHLGPRTVDVHIGRLRAALNEVGGKHLIRTVRSVGYALSD
jgi:two-component system, OmpR family, phosphate regulon response regulator PhoB